MIYCFYFSCCDFLRVLARVLMDLGKTAFSQLINVIFEKNQKIIHHWSIKMEAYFCRWVNDEIRIWSGLFLTIECLSKQNSDVITRLYKRTEIKADINISCCKRLYLWISALDQLNPTHCYGLYLLSVYLYSIVLMQYRLSTVLFYWFK